jgi:hypothetical protein
MLPMFLLPAGFELLTAAPTMWSQWLALELPGSSTALLAALSSHFHKASPVTLQLEM